MAEIIVDTNVAIVANGQNDDVVVSCVDACKEFIVAAREQHVLLLDDGDAIRQEYAGALKQSRPFALGALFLHHIYQNQFNPARVRRVTLLARADGQYADLPQSLIDAGFDPSDRKFAALGCKEGVPVHNATDSDWIEHAATLAAEGIEVEHLCGCIPAQWFTA